MCLWFSGPQDSWDKPRWRRNMLNVNCEFLVELTGCVKCFWLREAGDFYLASGETMRAAAPSGELMTDARWLRISITAHHPSLAEGIFSSNWSKEWVHTPLGGWAVGDVGCLDWFWMPECGSSNEAAIVTLIPVLPNILYVTSSIIIIRL